MSHFVPCMYILALCSFTYGAFLKTDSYIHIYIYIYVCVCVCVCVCVGYVLDKAKRVLKRRIIKKIYD